MECGVDYEQKIGKAVRWNDCWIFQGTIPEFMYTEKSHKNPQSGKLVLQAKYEVVTSWIQSTCSVILIMLLWCWESHCCLMPRTHAILRHPETDCKKLKTLKTNFIPKSYMHFLFHTSMLHVHRSHLPWFKYPKNTSKR